MRVLVVDDSRVFRRALQNELTLGGYDVAVAGHGQEALQALEREAFDLVTLDVDMPEMDGFDTCAHIRQGPRQDVRILFITSRESLEDRQRGFDLGANDFFHKKDFKAGELLATVDRMLKPNRLMEGLVAMVVDDSVVARNLATAPLREQGVTVFEAEDGDVALETLSKMADIDMVLTDRHMPRMGGDELCRHVRKQFGWKDVPVIFLTSAAEQHEVIEIFAAGATDYLHKPFTKEELLARLSVHLRARQLNQKLAAFTGQLEQRVKEATHEIRATNLLLEQRLREVMALNQVSLALCATQAVDDVLQETSRHAREVLDAEACTVYFLDRDIGELVMTGAGDTVRVKVEAGVDVRDADVGE
ncbi:MAG TPA: response regulator, partial [Candidatus Xenobia bacterium]